MRHVRTLGACLVAALAVAAVLATSASALPEFGECYVQAGHLGKYTNSTCTTKAKKNKVTEKYEGEFEWRKEPEMEPAMRRFAGESAATPLPVLATYVEFCVRGNQFVDVTCEGTEQEETIETFVECERETTSGELSGTKLVENVAIRLYGCKIFGSVPCQNTTEEGVVDFSILKGKLGWINHSATPREVGLQLEPAVSKRSLFAHFDCGGVTSVQLGVSPVSKTEKGYYREGKGGDDAVIAALTPVNVMSSAFTQVFADNGAFANTPSKFAGMAPIAALEGELYSAEEPEDRSAWSRSSLTLTNTLTPCNLESGRCEAGSAHAFEVKAN